MKTIVLAALLGVLAAMQGARASRPASPAPFLYVGAPQPPDESNVPDNEKRMPPGFHCKQPDVPIAKNERAVHCSCTYDCTIDEQGNVTERESPSCMGFCHVNGRKCTCWPEGDPQHPCVKEGHGNAIADMDGHVVAERVYR